MPELPEVENVRRTLNPLISHKKIMKVTVLYPNIIATPEVELFRNNLVGETFQQVSRRGKFLLLETEHFVLVSHLRMEGRYTLSSPNEPITKHTHLLIDLSDGNQLRYLDVRKFGRFALLKKDEVANYSSLKKLGMEPTEEDFSLEKFKKALKTKQNIKGLLLSQKVVVGLGNIYVDEVLYKSFIHPLRLSETLKEDEIVLLRKNIIEELNEAIILGGTTIRSYHNAKGETGHFQEFLQVYGKEGQPCVRCGSLIEKIKVAGRGTHFCPTCQRLEGSK